MKLLVFPKDPNPYQELLYSQLTDKVKVKYINPKSDTLLRIVILLPLLTAMLAINRLRGYKLIHVHWFYTFYAPQRLPLHRLVSYVQINAFFAILRILNFKIIWTVHNVLPQDQQTVNDQRLMGKLSQIADMKIVHSPHVIQEMQKLNFSTDNCKVIPIGSYANIYPDNISRTQARKKLNISEDETVILFFGLIQPYKGVDSLIKAYTSNKKSSRTRLIIAGKCASKSLAESLTRSIHKDPTIHFYNSFIPDDEVATYFRACDVVCLPFKKITTSSSVLLAMAFHKPVIAPYVGAIRDIPANAGLFYEPSVPNALQETVDTAILHKTELLRTGEIAYKYCETLSWDKIARQTYMAYREVLSLGLSEENNLSRSNIVT